MGEEDDTEGIEEEEEEEEGVDDEVLEALVECSDDRYEDIDREAIRVSRCRAVRTLV